MSLLNQRYFFILLWVVMYLCPFNKVTCQEKSDKSQSNLNLPFGFPLLTEDFIKVSSSFGYRMHPIHKKAHYHVGIDLVTQKGKPVYATAPGIVIKSRYEKGYGNNIIIAHWGGLKTLYGHLWFRVVENNEKVYKGQLIGFVGSTGNVTGPHLHYEIWLNNERVDPMLVWKNQLALSKFDTESNY